MSIMRSARCIMALSRPMTGERASGTATATSLSGSVVVPANSHLIPVVEGQLRQELLLKSSAEATVGVGGGPVSLISVVGGAAHNLAPATVCRWDPAVEGLTPTAPIVTLTGGTNPAFFGALKSVNIYETFGGSAPTLEAFRSRIRDFPAAIISWVGSEPADGQTVSALERGPSRAGRGNQLFTEKFYVTVISSRTDSDHARRHEGLEIIEELSAWLFDRNAVDGQVFSAPGGLQILARERLTPEDPLVWQNFYVYRLTVAVTVTQSKRDVRVYNDWLMTRTTWNTYGAGQAPDKTVADVTFPMRQTVPVIMSGNVVAGWDAASLTKTPVDLWPDEMGNYALSAAGSARLTWTTNGGPDLRPSVLCDGVAHHLSNTLLNLPAPLTTPTFIWAVLRQVTYSTGDRLWSAGAGNDNIALVQAGGASPTLTQRNPTADTNPHVGLSLNVFKIVQVLYSGSASDYIKAGDAILTTGASSGNADPSAGFSLGAASDGTLHSNAEFCEVWIFNAAPSAAKLALLRAYAVEKYPSLA